MSLRYLLRSTDASRLLPLRRPRTQGLSLATGPESCSRRRTAWPGTASPLPPFGHSLRARVVVGWSSYPSGAWLNCTRRAFRATPILQRQQNPYTVLGVAPDADDKAIKIAYFKAAKKTHPDLNVGDEHAKRRVGVWGRTCACVRFHTHTHTHTHTQARTHTCTHTHTHLTYPSFKSVPMRTSC